MKLLKHIARDLFNCLLKVILLVLTLSSVVFAAQDGQIVCRHQFKTSNNCYRLYKPADSVRGLVVMLPYYGSDANEFSSAALPGLLAEKNVATMVVSASGYLMDNDLVTLKGLIGEVLQELSLPAGSLVVGGISAGGTGAVRYSEYCSSGHCVARTKLCCLSWKWKERSFVKIMERTYEKRAQSLHRRRESKHPEATPLRQSPSFRFV